MRIAIVNDLIMAVEALRRVIAAVPGYEIAWVALNGREAVEKCAKDRPDLILMDLIMPVMDGVQATASIMKNSPCAIVVVTATVTGNAAKVFEAMGCGALDAVRTPVLDAEGKIEGAAELLKKIAIVGKLISADVPSLKLEAGQKKTAATAALPMIAIGSSTGGPKALAQILSRIPRSLGAGIVIIQHVDSSFAGDLAAWLGEQTGLCVTLAQDGMLLEPDRVFVAGTNDHLVIGPDSTLHYTQEPRNYPYRPSVDTFFHSVKQHWPRSDVAVLLTGMGRDGAKGLLGLRQAGWHTIVQDEKTSIIYGMPKAAAELGAAVEILPLETIADSIVRHLNN